MPCGSEPRSITASSTSDVVIDPQHAELTRPLRRDQHSAVGEYFDIDGILTTSPLVDDRLIGEPDQGHGIGDLVGRDEPATVRSDCQIDRRAIGVG